MLALGLPLGVVGADLLRQEAQGRLARESAQVASAVERQADRGALPSQARLSRLVSAGRQVTVVAPGLGSVRAGPSPGDEVRRATTTVGPVRVTVAEPADDAEGRVHNLWLLVAAAGAGGLALAAGLAAWQSRTLARPLEHLAAVSGQLGRGDLGARAGAQEMPEVDAVARALDRSADRIGRLIERERAFSSNVAHQIRTPLTALDMRLEELAAHPDPRVRHEAEAALEQTGRLRRTTDDLLDLARRGRAGDVDDLDIDLLLADRVHAWSPAVGAAGRRLAGPVAPAGSTARGSRAAVEQAIDVLIDNALRHGAGDIAVSASVYGGAVHVGVSDQGEGLDEAARERIFAPRSGGGGIGLSLARALLEAGGGRLSLASARPPRFEILLPAG